MKKTKLALMIVFLTSGISQAEYRVHIPLDPSISIKDLEVAGDIHLTPTVINRGGSSYIVWNYSYGNEINIEGLGDYNDKSGQVLVSPNVSTEYSIVIKNGSKSKTEKLSLTVIQPTQQINFTADKYRIGQGNEATLSWDVVDSSAVSIDNGVGSDLNEIGSSHVSPNVTTLYTLTAKGYEGISDSKKTVNIVVVPDSIINSFTVDNEKITTGESAMFSWQVANAESLSLNPFGPLVDFETGSQSIPFSTAGNYSYTLEAISLSGKEDIQSKNISVFDPAVISSFIVNGKRILNIAPNTDINFTWSSTSAPTLTLNDTAVTGTKSSLTSSSMAGNTNYVLKATNGANKSVSDTVVVTVIDNPTISGQTAPSNVFTNTPFTMSWAGSSITNYKLKSNNANSGLSTSDIDYGTVTSSSITPTAEGNYTYTLTAKNEADVTITSSKVVTVEADPIFNNFTVNGTSSITVSPNAGLSFLGTGYSVAAILAAKNADGSTTNFPSIASAIAGTTTYYAVATKTVNGVVRNSTVRSVSVTVVSAPTITSITAPTPVFVGSAFTMSWIGNNATNYKIKSNNGTSGIAITDIDVGTGVNRSITPTAAGTYTYTITATNAAGVAVTSTKQVVVEALPTFTGLTVNDAASITVAPSTALTFVGAGFSTGATLQARNSADSANATLPTTASSTAGTTTYYAAATKVVNGVTNYSPLRNVAVTVVNAPSVGAITIPTIINVNTAFIMSWSGTDVSNYTVNGSSTSSGLTTSAVSNGTATSRSITPTAAGSYTYTVTATNLAGVSFSKISGVVKVENWVATTPTYSVWANNGTVYNCSAWTPDASTVNTGTNLTQTRTCSQNQTRSRQERQTETGTGAIRNNGVAVTETQTISANGSQIAAGTKAVAQCQYSFGVGHQEYVWAMNRDDYGDYTIVMWNNQQIFYSDSMQYTTINSGAYNYYMGTAMSVGAYQVCRKPL